MDKRVKFDFEVFFTNGGGISGNDFRLDIQGDNISDDELANYIIKDLNLLMAGKVNILNKEIIEEAHKRKDDLNTNSEKGERLIDLSHSISDGLVTYKGLPAPIICDYWSREDSKELYEDGSSFQIGKIEMIANTGTYLDCPFHRYEDGDDLAKLKLEQLVDLPAIRITIPFDKKLKIEKDDLINYELRARAVLIQTNWSKKWNTEAYYENHPYLTKEAAEYLRDCRVKLVGIDSYNIDNTAEKSRPVHSILLKEDILIVEHMCNLDLLPDEDFLFSAVPPKIEGMGTFPVRAIAKI